MLGRDPFANIFHQQVVKTSVTDHMAQSIFAGLVPPGTVQIARFGKTPISAVIKPDVPPLEKPFSWDDYEKGLDYKKPEVEEDWSTPDAFTPHTMRVSTVCEATLRKDDHGTV